MALTLLSPNGDTLAAETPAWLGDADDLAAAAGAHAKMVTVGHLRTGRVIRLWLVKPQNGPPLALQLVNADDLATFREAEGQWAAGAQDRPEFTLQPG